MQQDTGYAGAGGNHLHNEPGLSVPPAGGLAGGLRAHRLAIALLAGLSAVLPLLAALVLNATPASCVLMGLVTLSAGSALLAARVAANALAQCRYKTEQVHALEARLSDEEAACKTARQEADAAQRSKTALFAAASHELRTPLTGIIGVMDLLRSEIAAGGRARYLVDVATSSADALLCLVNDVLHLARIDAGRFDISPADVDLYDALRRGVEPMRLRAHQQGLLLSFEWQAGLPHAWHVDVRRVRQAVSNLVGNAVKFTETGSVSVHVSGHPLDEQEGDWALSIAVADTGVGIAPEAQVKLFDGFEADGGIVRRYGGTGLGLHVSRQIACAMGGTIQVVSSPGQGSCFTMTLQAKGAQSRLAQTGPALGAHDVSLQVLLADDNATNRFVVSEHLQRWGHEVHLAEDGRQALDACAARRFDLVLLDGRMPQLDGVQTLERLRGFTLDDAAPQDHEVFVAAISANTTAEDGAAFARAGAQAFIGKPVELRALHEVVQRAIAHQRRRRIALPPNQHAAPAGEGETLQPCLAQEDKEQGAALADEQQGREARMLAVFAAELPGHVMRLQDARDSADLAALSEIAHALKGASVYVDLPVLTHLATQTELQARDGSRQAALASAAALQRCVAELAEAPSAEEVAA